MGFLDWKVWDRLDAVDRRLGLRGDHPPEKRPRITRRLLYVMARVARVLTTRSLMWDRVEQLFRRGDALTSRQALDGMIAPLRQRGDALEREPERRRPEAQMRGQAYLDE